MAAGATSSIGRPRLAAISSGRFRLFSAATVACTTLIGLDEPSERDSTSWMPAHSSTARTGPPAMPPGPGVGRLDHRDPARVLALHGVRDGAGNHRPPEKVLLGSSTPLAM